MTMNRLLWVGVAIAVAAVPIPVEAGLVDASELASVYTSAPWFDTRLGENSGCDPAGCVGELTRDGDSSTSMSRWSCKPELGPEGTVCAIIYSFDAPLDLQQLRVALSKGDERQRTLEVYVEDDLVTTWTSSGLTTDFETIELTGSPAQTIELRGVLSRTEWLSIAEVEIMVYDGSTVEVGTLGTVETSATYFDTRVRDDGGCDPEGCEPSQTRDSDLSDNSRWSCAPTLGGECTIVYDLGAVYDLSGLSLALYKGSERSITVDIIIDGDVATTWTSSGTTDGYERIDLSGASGQVIEIRGDLPEPNTWLSIIETRIMVIDNSTPPSPTPPSPTPPSPTPSGDVPATRKTSDGRLIVEAGELGWVVLSPQSYNLHDSRTAAYNGCDPTGCVKEYTRDGSLDSNSRWSCQFSPWGTTESDLARYQCRIFYNLRQAREIHALRVALHGGEQRTRTLDVWIDDVQWVPEWTSSGTTSDFETIPMPTTGIIGQEITIRAFLEVDEWISITEVAIDVVVDDVPLLGVSASDRIAVTATASAGEPDVLLDGTTDDSASSWACSGADCSVTFDLQAVEELVQISVAFAEDGDMASNIFDVYVGYSEAGPFSKVLSDAPSDKDRPLSLQQFRIAELARYVRIEPSALGSGSLDITEVDIRVAEETPIRSVAVDTSLDKVGLLPMAEGDRGDQRTEEEGGCGTQGCRLFNVKDGVTSTFWRCYGSPEDPDSLYTSYDCSVDIDFVYYRHLKQIRIALPDGAERANEMRFSARRTISYIGEEYVEESVMSSGVTDGFETYDFDVFTRSLEVSAVFRGAMQSISIAEMEFLEEPFTGGEIPVGRFSGPYNSAAEYPEELRYENGFAWGHDENVIGGTLNFYPAFFATVSAIELKFPMGERYGFNLIVYDIDDVYEDGIMQEGLESAGDGDYQTFSLDFLPTGLVVERVSIEMLGTVDGEDSFTLLDGRILGSIVDNPTNVLQVASTGIESWISYRYPDFIGEGSGDQKVIMEAICTVKKATFDGVDCVGGDPDATGEVELAMGEYMVNGNVYMQSGVHLNGRFSGDDSPYTTDFILEDDAAGNTEEPAIVVFDGIQDALMSDVWIRGLYDPETDNSVSAVSGLGSKCLKIVDCKNVTAQDFEAQFCDGDALTVINSQMVNIDAGRYDDEYIPWSISESRGIGLLIEGSDSVWIRRHTLYDNGEAGLVIRDTRNVTFEATYREGESTGEGNVGSLDGQQPVEVVIEASTLITFDHMRVTSANEPAIVVSADSTDVSFVECAFGAIESGSCIIEAGNPSAVMITDSDEELVLENGCFEKV